MLTIYNSLTKKEEEFVPIDASQVSLYTCGPTVYNYPHIGNYRAYIFADLLKRTLSYNNYNVKHVMNLTDIDDKTIRDSQKASKSLKEFTEFYTEEFFKDRDMLNILPADVYPKATDYIDEMVAIIETLLEKGFAYKSEDGSVYFDIAKDKEYGKLSHLDMESLKSNASGRIKSDEYEKDNVQDFALWKAYDEADGDVFWETSLGKGRPGWHIECSAMSMKNLGEHIDIHTGGRDNMFPHHENEIAQSECATGHKFVNIWMHNEWLLVDGKKMAKSANNFYTLRDVVEKGYDPLAFRYLNLLNHYKTPLNFTWEGLDAAATALTKLHKTFQNFGEVVGEPDINYVASFNEAINKDLGIPKALGIAWKMFKDKSVSNENKKATLLAFDKVLGLGL
jgi:cysteinyl-tRNA synthetase